MPDKYANFAELAKCEPSVAYAISHHQTGSSTAIVAPHGGGIEPGTSELCLQIAGEDLSWYRFEGCKAAHNGDLHITSSNFDEPTCLELIGASRRVLTIHGERSEENVVYIGGLHRLTIEVLLTSLDAAGFVVRQHENPNLQGQSARNICNLGQLRQGVQLEIAKGLRRQFFLGLSHDQRKQKTELCDLFCEAVRRGLEMAPV